MYQSGLTVTSTGTAVSSPMPLDAQNAFPTYVRLSASAPAYVRLSEDGADAVVGDMLVQPRDDVYLMAAFCKSISVLSVSGTASVSVSPDDVSQWSGVNPTTLDLNFITSQTLSPKVTFTRASSGTHFDSTGRLVTDGNNVARFDYDPAVAISQNLLLWSDDLTNASWTKTGAGTGTAPQITGQVTAPDGTNTAWRAVFDKGAGATSGDQSQITQIESSKGTGIFGLWMKSNTGSTYLVRVGNNSALVASVTPTWGFFQTGANEQLTRIALRGTLGTSNYADVSIWHPQFGISPLTPYVATTSAEVRVFTPRGLLIEEQRTNLLLHSRDMTQAAWSKTDVTAARTQVGIDGVASTACLMTEAAGGSAATIQTAGAVTAGSTITGSVVVKRGNTDWFRIQVAETAGVDGADAWFNLGTGVKGSVVARGAGTSNSSTMTSLGGGWYRCTLTTIPNGSYTIPRIVVLSAASDGSSTRVANATYIVDCAQLEVGAFATSIITTGAATATRAADVASMTGSNFSSWFNASAGTFVVEYDSVATANARALALGPTSVGAYLSTAAVNGSQTGWFASGVAAIGYTAGATIKRAIAFNNTGNFDANTNGGAVQTSAASDYTGTGTNAIYFGANAAGNYLNGHLRSIRYYNTRLPNATLSALTS